MLRMVPPLPAAIQRFPTSSVRKAVPFSTMSTTVRHAFGERLTAGVGGQWCSYRERLTGETDGRSQRSVVLIQGETDGRSRRPEQRKGAEFPPDGDAIQTGRCQWKAERNGKPSGCFLAKSAYHIIYVCVSKSLVSFQWKAEISPVQRLQTIAHRSDTKQTKLFLNS